MEGHKLKIIAITFLAAVLLSTASCTWRPPSTITDQQAVDLANQAFAGDQQALATLKSCAAKNQLSCEWGLGIFYKFTGNNDQVVYWSRKAANSEHAKAEQHLGILYDTGKGVPQDHTKAMYWYERAAEHGGVEEQWSLGSVYENSNGGCKKFCVNGHPAGYCRTP